ncbi:MAG TPA: GrpB family protein [Casimicrobiaceae bacterium]|nr:GrpB family protein [Casimicrobiaceae bacterium]
MTHKSPILPYSNSGAGYVEYDRAAIDVAGVVAGLIERAAPWAKVEHIGSTAIPGCAGKGIVDVMVMYPAHQLEATRVAIDRLGFQPQKTGHIFPDERPMRVGAIEHDGKRYRLHAHVIAMTSSEIASLRRFRDLLRADAALRDAYQDKKRAILQSGLSEPRAYTQAKGEFISSVMGGEATHR